MAATDIGTGNIPPIDDLDDSLFDYDAGDVFRDVDTNMDIPAVQKPAARADEKENGANLGIDKEIKVTKKRASVPKLDENRLLSPAGIPKLRRVAKERLKFKGKGHEYSDVARLLNIYQLWLDDLYPRAKFTDGLAMIEKLGHTKRMQMMRREWINEGKSRKCLNSLGHGIDKPAGQHISSKPREDQPWEATSRERPLTPIAVVGYDDNPYPATSKPARDNGTANRNADTGSLCLDDSTETVSVVGRKPYSLNREDDFDDDEDALLTLNDGW